MKYYITHALLFTVMFIATKTWTLGEANESALTLEENTTNDASPKSECQIELEIKLAKLFDDRDNNAISDAEWRKEMRHLLYMCSQKHAPNYSQEIENFIPGIQKWGPYFLGSIVLTATFISLQCLYDMYRNRRANKEKLTIPQ